MYGIPQDLDLSPIVGEFTTQLRVGQFDLQFTLGGVDFAVQSPVTLYREGRQIGGWTEGHWPDPAFYEVLNSEVEQYRIEDARRIVIEFANGVAMHLEDNSDQYESMQISSQSPTSSWII